MVVVIVNKMDTCDWSEERYNYIKKNLSEFLKTSCGFEEDKTFWCAIEGLTGKNIIDPINVEWY